MYIITELLVLLHKFFIDNSQLHFYRPITRDVFIIRNIKNETTFRKRLLDEINRTQECFLSWVIARRPSRPFSVSQTGQQKVEEVGGSIMPQTEISAQLFV